LDRSTYFDYGYASIARLRSLTSFPITLLVDREALENQYMRSSLALIQKFDVKIEEVPVWFIRNYLSNNNSRKQSREKHRYTYYNLYIFHPEFSKRYSKIIFLDIDTFVLRNIDELFCSDAYLAAAQRVNNVRSDFNSGVYLYSPQKSDFRTVMTRSQ